MVKQAGQRKAKLAKREMVISYGPSRQRIKLFNSLGEECSQRRMFSALRNAFDRKPRKVMNFKESVFPWGEISLSQDELMLKMLCTIAEEPSSDYVDLLLDYREKMSARARYLLVDAYLAQPKTEKQRTALVHLLGDRSSSVQEKSMSNIGKIKLTQDDYIIVEDLLRYKSGDLRKNAIQILTRQSPRHLLDSIRRLAESGDEAKGLAALDIIAALEGKPKYKGILSKCRNLAIGVSGSSQQTRILASKINSKSDYSLANGLGLFAPNQELPLPSLSYSQGFLPQQLFTSTPEELEAKLRQFDGLIDRHRDLEYEVEAWEGREKVVLGSSGLLPFRRGGNEGLDSYPLAEVWRQAARDLELTAVQILEMLLYFSASSRLDEYRKCMCGSWKIFSNGL